MHEVFIFTIIRVCGKCFWWTHPIHSLSIWGAQHLQIRDQEHLWSNGPWPSIWKGQSDLPRCSDSCFLFVAVVWQSLRHCHEFTFISCVSSYTVARYDLVLSRPHSCHCPIISPSRIGKSSFQDLVLSCRAEGKATSSALEDYSQRKRMDLGALIDETLDPGGFDLLQIDQGVTHNNGIWSSRRPSHMWRTHALLRLRPSESVSGDSGNSWRGRCLYQHQVSPKAVVPFSCRVAEFSWVSQYRSLFFPCSSFNVSVTSGIDWVTRDERLSLSFLLVAVSLQVHDTNLWILCFRVRQGQGCYVRNWGQNVKDPSNVKDPRGQGVKIWRSEKGTLVYILFSRAYRKKVEVGWI